MGRFVGEAKSIGDLEIGKVYACAWRDHELTSRAEQLEYVRICEISSSTKSGELVKTSAGNRVFSRLRWFGPFPSTVADIGN